jgi:type II secretory pathway component PulK
MENMRDRLSKKMSFIRSNSRGFAILTVLVSIALLLAVVTELSTKEFVRYKMAINERDSLQAEALAQSGANLAQLILVLQEPVQEQLANLANMGIQLPSYTLWSLVPIDSELFRGVSEGSFMPDLGLGGKNAAAPKKEVKEAKAKPEINLRGPYENPPNGFGGFEGTFSTEISDEESKLSIKKWATLSSPERRKAIADQIIKILETPENAILFDGSTGDNKGIMARKLVGNIYDYSSASETAVDIDAPRETFGRDSSVSKQVSYQGMPNGILPKNAPFDSLAELRLVPGMTDAIFQVLQKHISVYGESDKINILSAPDSMMAMVFSACAANRDTGQFQAQGFAESLMAAWNKKKADGEAKISLDGIKAFLEENKVPYDQKSCSDVVGTASKTFTVKSTATVGNVTKTLEIVLRSSGGLSDLYKFQYL